MIQAILVVVWVAVGLTIGWFWSQRVARDRNAAQQLKAESDAGEALATAKAQADQILNGVEAKANEEIDRRVKQHERDLARKRNEFERNERRLSQQNSDLDRKIEAATQREGQLKKLEDEAQRHNEKLQNQQREAEKLKAEAIRRCEEISGLSMEQSKKLLLELMESEVKQDAAAMVRRIETETKELANKKARQIITLAIQKCATEQVGETTVSVVNLPNDEMKGRIIGREGRNIRALEAATGCDIIVDDTPEAILLSCFDPLRREVARISIERLLGDGRIHPARIEEVVAKVEKELADHIREVGEQAVFDMGLANMHPELIRTLGRLKYRTSYGQNILSHSMEVGRLCSFMAAELGADIEAAKRAGMLHDIGKALSYEMEGTHALIGAELAKKCNEAPGVVHAIAAHHNEEEPRTIIAVLVQAADAISSSRPGVRRESLENYIKRMEKLETIATEFSGVSKAYALQAGRELRIIVEPTAINDNEAAMLARDIAKKIEKGGLEYPGQIKVTVCRETRAVEYAK